MGKEIQKEHNEDLSIFQAEIFKTRQFNNIQEDQQALTKSPSFPPTAFFNKEAITEKTKAQLFNQFLRFPCNECCVNKTTVTSSFYLAYIRNSTNRSEYEYT